MDGLKAKTLEYECLNNVWTSDGTPFEEPELSSDPTCLISHDRRSHECEPQTEVREVRPNAETAPAVGVARIVGFLLRFGWMR